MSHTISGVIALGVIVEANCVHVYCKNVICSDVQLACYEKILSSAELSRAKKFVKESDQKKFIAQKGMAREILSSYLQKKPAEIEFTFGEHGKPSIKNNLLQFNVSHSGDYFLMGVTRDAAIGVDIECVRKNHDFFALAKRFFTPVEFAAIKNENDFYRCWTRKEAFIKATGLGLSFGLANFEVDVLDNFSDQSCLLNISNNLFSKTDWIVRSISFDHIKSTYFAAVAAQKKVDQIIIRNYSSELC